MINREDAEFLLERATDLLSELVAGVVELNERINDLTEENEDLANQITALEEQVD